MPSSISAPEDEFRSRRRARCRSRGRHQSIAVDSLSVFRAIAVIILRSLPFASPCIRCYMPDSIRFATKATLFRDLLRPSIEKGLHNPTPYSSNGSSGSRCAGSAFDAVPLELGLSLFMFALASCISTEHGRAVGSNYRAFP